MLNMLKKKGKPSRMPDVNVPRRTSYHSLDVPIPADFLSVTNPPADSKPIEVHPIAFARTAVPEYSGLYAVVLDNVLSPSECDLLLKLAESSVPPTEETVGENGEVDPWQPALVNIGVGWEVLQADYRNSDRIIWDRDEVTERLWKRVQTGAPEVAEQLKEVEADKEVLGGSSWREQRWVFKALNRRMRFLRIRTIFTLHLYLNDSAEGVKGEKDRKGPKPELVGGSTPFLSNDEKRRIDVHPKAGRMLIFQHRRLLHSGDDVVKGTKYTMRSDILYELVPNKEGKEVDSDDGVTESDE